MHPHDLLPSQLPAVHRVAALGDLPLESGAAIKAYQQSYVTHGNLNARRDNVVLVCAAISADHHRLDFLIGEGKALDPSRWFIICTDPIGNWLSTSPSNSESQPRMTFPRFTIRDMVAAQHKLLCALGIERIACVIGASMGGMQALQWAASRPLRVDSVVAMNAAARTSSWSVAVNESTRACLMADPAWNGREFTATPERGWHAWFMVQRVLASRSPQSVEADVGLNRARTDPFAAWEGQWKPSRPEAHDFLYQSWAYDEHDVEPMMLARFNSRALLLAPPLDLYNPTSGVVATARSIPGATFLEIPSIRGHQSASGSDAGDASFLNRAIGKFVARDA